MKKTVIILNHNGGRLGNQLWSFAQILAYCLERNYAYKNYCFYQYDRFFQTPLTNPFADFISRITPGRIKVRIHRKITERIIQKYGSRIIYDTADLSQGKIVPFYLPPTPAADPEHSRQIRDVEQSPDKEIFLNGWLFRNPDGLQKHRAEIVQILQPRNSIQRRIEKNIFPLRSQFEKIVGIHIRKKDYKMFGGGRFYFTEHQARRTIDSYLDHTGQDAKKVFFLVCTDDEQIDVRAFLGLSWKIGSSSPVEAMYSLASTDIIIGSDSTFGGFAAYYGNIPIVFFSHSPIEWNKVLTQREFTYWNGSTNLQL